MAAPSSSGHIDRPLSDLALRYKNAGSVIDHVFPPFYVTKESDLFRTIDDDDFREEDTGPRAMNEPATRAQHGYGQARYDVETHSLFDIVSDREEDNADDPLRPRKNSVYNLSKKLLLGREIKAASLAFGASNFTQSNHTAIASASRWDKAAGKPLKDINDAADKVRERTGMMANSMLLGAKAMSALQSNPDVLDRFKYVREGAVPPKILARYFDWLMGDGIAVGRMVKNTAKEGATDAKSDVWGNSCLVFYRDPDQAMDPEMDAQTMSFGRNFRPRRDSLVVRSRWQNPPGQHLYVQKQYGLEILDDACGELLTTVTG